MSKNHVLCMWFLVLWQWKFWTPWKYFVSLGILYWNKIHSIKCYFFVLLNGSHKYYWIGIDVLFHVKISFIEKPKKWTTEKTSAIKFGYFSLSTYMQLQVNCSLMNIYLSIRNNLIIGIKLQEKPLYHLIIQL